MGEASDALGASSPASIERHIRETRGELERNVEELESRVKRAADWRRQVSNRPLSAVGVAFAGGLLASLLVGSRQSSNGRYSVAYQSTPAGNPRMRRALGSLQGAILALASVEARNFLTRALAASRERMRHKRPGQDAPVASL